MQQHFYQNPSQMVNLPADDFANLANYFNVPSPTAMPSFSPMNMGGPINGNTQPSFTNNATTDLRASAKTFIQF